MGQRNAIVSLHTYFTAERGLISKAVLGHSRDSARGEKEGLTEQIADRRRVRVTCQIMWIEAADRPRLADAPISFSDDQLDD